MVAVGFPPVPSPFYTLFSGRVWCSFTPSVCSVGLSSLPCCEMSVCLSPGTPCQINKVLSHPTLPITITAQEDRHIKFFDNNSGKLIHSMVAHLDAVTSLAVDPNGLYLMSGSKYRFPTMSSLMVCLSSHLIWQRRTPKHTVR